MKSFIVPDRRAFAVSVTQQNDKLYRNNNNNARMHNLQTRRQRTLLCHAVCVGMRGSRRKKYVPNIRSHHPHESVGVCVCACKEKPKKYGHTRFHVHHKLSVNSRSPPVYVEYIERVPNARNTNWQREIITRRSAT